MNLPIFGRQPKISTNFFSSLVFNVLFTFLLSFTLRAGGQLLLWLSWVVFVNKLKIPSKNCKSVTPANSSRQKWRMDILEVTIIFSWFFTDCLYHSEALPQSLNFFGNVETNPQIMSSNQVGKTLTVTDNLLEAQDYFGKWQPKTKSERRSMRQFSTTLSFWSEGKHVTKCHQSCRYSHTFCLCSHSGTSHGSLTKMWP